uniref:Uncharacterized protein n=1 Tax=Rhizophora mucronata TaxID=61149 RepID=A0A2P2R4P0_RHIMU
MLNLELHGKSSPTTARITVFGTLT